MASFEMVDDFVDMIPWHNFKIAYDFVDMIYETFLHGKHCTREREPR